MGPRIERKPYKQQDSPTFSAVCPAVKQGKKYVIMQTPQLLKHPNNPFCQSPIFAVFFSYFFSSKKKLNRKKQLNVYSDVYSARPWTNICCCTYDRWVCEAGNDLIGQPTSFNGLTYAISLRYSQEYIHAPTGLIYYTIQTIITFHRNC